MPVSTPRTIRPDTARSWPRPSLASRGAEMAAKRAKKAKPARSARRAKPAKRLTPAKRVKPKPKTKPKPQAKKRLAASKPKPKPAPKRPTGAAAAPRPSPRLEIPAAEPGALAGVKVVELAHIMAGPTCGLMLAD